MRELEYDGTFERDTSWAIIRRRISTGSLCALRAAASRPRKGVSNDNGALYL
jgi:hypothetical protein